MGVLQFDDDDRMMWRYHELFAVIGHVPLLTVPL